MLIRLSAHFISTSFSKTTQTSKVSLPEIFVRFSARKPAVPSIGRRRQALSSGRFLLWCIFSCSTPVPVGEDKIIPVPVTCVPAQEVQHIDPREGGMFRFLT
jgi:hypothetical protein